MARDRCRAAEDAADNLAYATPYRPRAGGGRAGTDSHTATRIGNLEPRVSRDSGVEPEEPPVRGYAVTHPGGTAVLPQSSGWDQLIYATAGVMSVHTPDGTWVVPPDRAVWVPAGAKHTIAMAGRTAIRTLYLRAGLVRGLPAGCRAVNVTPLLRELIRYAVEKSPLYLDNPPQHRLVGVILDQLAELPAAPLRLPIPKDPRARAVADALRDDPARATASSGGASRRTLERIFRAETGLSLGQYRERARLLAALPRLASGEPVARVAADVGYATPSAFGAMFKRILSTSPTRYFSPP
jgi:AraC-like DNA-binding protein